MTHLVSIDPLLFAPGDRMSREEFLARWQQMPGLKFAELIEGVVYMPSPVSYEHTRRDGLMQTVLAAYVVRTRICELLPNGTWLMLESAPQPDIALRRLPQFGGQTAIEGTFATGAPELVVEVARSSRSYDLGPKLALYQRAGVAEYVTVLIEEQRIEWRALQEDGSYRKLAAGSDGTFRSQEFEGLWINEPAFWAGDIEQLTHTLDQGLSEGGKA